jgi:L-alanine-DL-glutamate epimerase-like enolase superfamily enzyme
VKIASVESIQLRIPLAGEGRLEIGSWGGKGLPTVDSLIVKVVTDTGVVGWGETFGFAGIPAGKAAIDSILAPALVGRDSALLEKLILRPQRGCYLRTVRDRYRAVGYRGQGGEPASARVARRQRCGLPAVLR